MPIPFTPTTTIDKLLANNTSAADSFPGLPNGMPAPSAVGGGSLGVPQEAFEHDVKWFKAGQTIHSAVGYSSDDPMHIGRQLVAYNRTGRRGANWLWNGSGGQQDIACLAAVGVFEQVGSKFDIMLSSTIPTIKNAIDKASRTKAFNAVLDYLRLKFFHSPAYHRFNSRPVVYCFGLGNNDFDWTAIRAHAHTFGADEPMFAFRMENDYSAHFCADMYFAWTHCDEAWITHAKTFGKPIILAANPGFDNSVAVALPSGWGTLTHISQDGGIRWLTQLDLARNHPECPILLIVTGTDYDEGSAIEPGIATGKSLTLGFDDTNNRLTWTDPGVAFNNFSLWVSKDGNALMWLSDYLTCSAQLSLYDLDFGTWKFVVVANGKNSIQSIKSNVITVNKVVDWK